MVMSHVDVKENGVRISFAEIGWHGQTGRPKLAGPYLLAPED
jgi:hypothetical protein